MPNRRLKPIIAVFGSNEPTCEQLAAARYFGAEVNSEGATLLTGGQGDDPNTVKDAAILAATEREPADWIGVLNSANSAPPRKGRAAGVVLTPGFRHRRNLVEACLCDAAIVIGDSEGTSSEALFSLYLRRPLVLVGVDKLSPTSAITTALKEAALRRIPSTLAPLTAIDQGIDAAYRWAEKPDRAPTYRPLPTNRSAAAQIVRDLVHKVASVGERHDLWALKDQTSWDAFVRGAIRSAGRT
jgi:hypothetical protein